MAQGSETESPIVTYNDLCHHLSINIITEERRKILSFFQVERNFIHSDEIKDDTLFILKLEQYGVISDSSVDQLLECLESLKMMKLAATVTNYISTTDAGKDSNKEQDPSEDMSLCQVHQNPLDIMCYTCEKKVCYSCGLNEHRDQDHVLYFLLTSDTDSKEENKVTEEVNLCKKHRKKLVITCNTCNDIMCYICAFHDHREENHVLNFPGDTNHCVEHQKSLTVLCNSCNEVICNVCVFRRHRGKDHVISSGSEVDEIVNKTVKLLLENVAILGNTLENMEPSIVARTNTSSEITQDALHAQFGIWAKQANNDMSNTKKELELHKARKDENTKKLLKYIEKVNTDLEELKGQLRNVTNIRSTGVQLKKLKQWERFIANCKTKLNDENQTLKSHRYLRACFRPLSSDNGRFVKFHSSVIGAVCVSNYVAVVVRDKRHFGGKVTLSCIEHGKLGTSEHGQLLWEHSTGDIEKTYPVVMAGSPYVCNMKRRILIACGQTIFSFTIENQNEDVKIADTESKLVAVPDGNYITSMNKMTNKLSVLDDVGVMISINASTELLRLNEELDIVERFDCREIVNSIACMACVDRDVALVDSVRNEVVLINTGKIVSLSGKLEAPNNLPNSFRPKVIQWDGSFWGVIWESVVHQREAGPQWQHSVYPMNAKKSYSGISDTCSLNTEIVSISFMRNQTLVCLSDGKVKLFGTNDAVSELSELANLPDLPQLSDMLMQMLQRDFE